jgi:actin, other eukaryote
MVGMDQRSHFVGDEAVARKGILSLSYPVVRGVVKDWDEMDFILEHLFENELMIAPEEHPMLFSEPVNNVRANRETLTQLLFEKYNVPGMYLSIQGVLALYASGTMTGCALDCGEGQTSAVPVYEGHALSHAMQKIDLAGWDITDQLMKELVLRGHSMSTESERDCVRDIKEKLGFVTQNFDSEVEQFKDYQLPDGQIISVGAERFHSTEILFQPQALTGRELFGIHELVFNSIAKCDIDLRRDLFNHIIACGGTTSLGGFSERLKLELKKIAPPSINIHIATAAERKYAVWIGGSILSSLSTFQNMWISRGEYDEQGVSIVHRNV